MDIARLVASIKFLPIYTCSDCGKQDLGSTVRREYVAPSLDNLMSQIAFERATSTYMPIGWSYHGQFTCSICTQELRKGMKK